MKRRGISRLLASRSAGQAAAEFAGTATVFLLLLFCVMQMAMAVNAYNDVCTAAREAARYAIVHSPTSQNQNPAYSASNIQQQAVNYAPFLSLSGSGCASDSQPCDVVVSFPADTRIPSQTDALVQITHTYPLKIPFVSTINLHLSASSQMLVSQ